MKSEIKPTATNERDSAESSNQGQEFPQPRRLARRSFLRNLGMGAALLAPGDRKSTRLNSSHTVISYAVFCLKKKTQKQTGGGAASFIIRALRRLRRECFGI